jgi:hypothetical protein
MEQVKSVDQLYNLIAKKNIYWVEVRIVSGPIFTRHQYTLADGKYISDFSYVDESETEWTKEEFENSLYGERIKQGRMYIEEIETI